MAVENTTSAKSKNTNKTLSLYIEENYVGSSSWGIYHFDSAVPLLEKAKSLVRQEEAEKNISTGIPLGGSNDFNARFSIFNSQAQANDEDLDFLSTFEKLSRLEQQCSVQRYERIKQLVEMTDREDTFTSYMLKLIVEKGLSESNVYNSVFMDRRLFNKIRNDPGYQPSKRTALLIAVSLKLTLAETQELLSKAGYALTHCNKRDLIVEYFIREGNYDIFEINETLAQFKQPLLMKCE